MRREEEPEEEMRLEGVGAREKMSAGWAVRGTGVSYQRRWRGELRLLAYLGRPCGR